MRYTLRQLAVFVETARTGQVSQAAQVLNLSQSATSASLAELESNLTPLFDRLGRRLLLNSAGERLLPEAINLLDQARRLEQLALEAGEGFQLKLGATQTIGNYLAPKLVHEFEQRHPNSHVELFVQNTQQVLNALEHFEIDLALIEGPCTSEAFRVDSWRQDELVIFCAPGHPLARHHELTVSLLTHQKWILREKGSGTRQSFDMAIAAVGVELDVRFSLEHTEGIKQAVEDGLGIGCVSRLAVQPDIDRGSLVEMPAPFLDLTRTFSVVSHARRPDTQGIQQFRQDVLDQE